MNYFQQILGAGLDYPVQYERGKIKTAAGIESVVAAIWMLFGTRKGTRFMMPEYGSHLHNLVFEPCSHITGQTASIFAREDILEWIPRVERISVNYRLYNEESMIELVISLVLRSSPNEYVMTYPFYLESERYQGTRRQPTYAIIN